MIASYFSKQVIRRETSRMFGQDSTRPFRNGTLSYREFALRLTFQQIFSSKLMN